MPDTPQSFEELVARCKPSLEGTARRFFRNTPYLCEEAVSEAITRAFEKYSSFKKKASFSTWMHSILESVCLDMIRERDQEREVLGLLYDSKKEGEWVEEEEPPPVAFSDEISLYVEEEEATYQICLVVGDLWWVARTPKPFDRVLYEEWVNTTSRKEIAALLGKSTGAIDVALHRMKKKILV